MDEVKKELLEIESVIGTTQLELSKQRTILKMIFEMSNTDEYPTGTPEEKAISAMKALNVIQDIQNLALTSIDQNNKMYSALEEGGATATKCLSKVNLA